MKIEIKKLTITDAQSIIGGGLPGGTEGGPEGPSGDLKWSGCQDQI